MKRLLLVVLALCLSGVCWADKASDIANIKNQINTLENETPAMLERLGTLKTEKENQIDFVSQAYDKQKAQFEQDATAFSQKANDLKRQYQLLEPALENYNQRVTAHNSRQCTETCTNGVCDGSCAWYTAEKAQLDANQAQLQQAYAPLDSQKAQLATQQSYLEQTSEKLETIRTGLNDEIASWKSKIQQLQAEWEEHQKKIAALQQQLAAIYGSVNQCLADIPVECERPRIDPATGKPVLDQNCEIMKADCSKMFDGNR
jgi:chromosome segregation ATPase